MDRKLGRRRVHIVGLMMLGLIGAFVGGAYGNHVFSDVPSNAFYHSDVTWLANTGITAGCGGTKFCPESPVTRGQMAVFLHKMVNRPRTGHFSCDGSSFVATASDTGFGTNVSGGVWRYRTSGLGIFWCNVVIPDGATITKVSFAVKDFDNTAEVSAGALSRTHLTAGTPTLMAFTNSSGVATVSSSVVTLEDTTISAPVVDNAIYSYRLEVSMDGTDSDVGIYGATIEYTYPGTPAP